MACGRVQGWINRPKDGDCAFITTRCLNWAHCFASPDQRDAVTHSILSDCRLYGADIHAFVSMSNHIHLLLNVPQGMSVSVLMQRLKAKSSKRLLPLLSQEQVDQLKEQSGLSRRRLWQNGFRSLVVFSQTVFETKLNYIEQNPPRAGLGSAEDYRWSSLHMVQQGFTDSFGDIDLDRCIGFYSRLEADVR